MIPNIPIYKISIWRSYDSHILGAVLPADTTPVLSGISDIGYSSGFSNSSRSFVAISRK
jgi:hypothetical protein